MENIYEIAKYFLSKSPMNHKKLEKLCYYAQAWHLAIYGTRLVDSSFQAWVHGPVSPELWTYYRDWGGLRIPQFVGQIHFSDPNTCTFLDKIFNLYGDYSGDTLEYFTHQEPPWQKARDGYPPQAICRNEISDRDMADYYRSRLN